MISTFRNSLAFRSALLYEFVLKRLSSIHSPKQISEINLCSMVSNTHIDMLVQSLFSLAKTSDYIPHLHIVSDGSIAPFQIKKKMKWWKGPLTVYSLEELVELKKDVPDTLIEFSKKSIFGKKFLTINNIPKPLLWVDSDVLWFKPWESILQTEHIKLSQDVQACYDPYFKLKYIGFDKSPYYNVGLVYLREDLKFDIDALADLEQISKNPHHFSEQSLLGVISYKENIEPWPLDLIFLGLNDQLTLGPSFRKRAWTARHYVGPVRHLFWRDAFFLRMGLKP